MSNICLAENMDIALAAKGGTLGLGLESTIALHPKFNAWVRFNYFPYDDDDTYSGINYDYSTYYNRLTGTPRASDSG